MSVRVVGGTAGKNALVSSASVAIGFAFVALHASRSNLGEKVIASFANFTITTFNLIIRLVQFHQTRTAISGERNRRLQASQGLSLRPPEVEPVVLLLRY